MSSLFIRDPSAMGFAQGEYVFQSVFANRFEKREANSGPLCAGFQYLLRVVDQRSTVDVKSPLNVLTRIGQKAAGAPGT
jgi:hypothetical protein